MDTPWPRRLAMTKAEAAIAGGFSQRHLDRIIASGELRAFLVGGRWRIFPDDLESYIRGEPPKGPAPKLRVVSVCGRHRP